MPNVSFKHPALTSVYPEYVLINDVLAGETKIKSKKMLYLPNPAGSFRSKQNIDRYNAYLKRAVFYNIARNTLKSLVGIVFAADPVTNMGEEFSLFMNDVTGTGVSIKQLAKQLLRYNVAYSRAGVFVDFLLSMVAQARLIFKPAGHGLQCMVTRHLRYTTGEWLKMGHRTN